MSEVVGGVMRWLACFNAYTFCSFGELLPIQASGVNLYDVTKPTYFMIPFGS